MKKLSRYYIEDKEGFFWCERNIGYWSDFDSSLKYRFEGVYLWVKPLQILMRLCGTKCYVRRIECSGDKFSG